MRSIIRVLAVATCVAVPGLAHAQIQVEGEASVTVGQPPIYVQPQQQPYQQPYPPPPGYGQYPQQPPVYGQPYQQPYYAPPPRQPMYVERDTSTHALWVPGVILLPLSWVLTWTSAVATQPGSSRDIDYMLFSWIPVAGPWFMLGQDDNRPLNGAEIAGALLSGIAQVGSIVLIILGLSIRQRVRTMVMGENRGPEIDFTVIPTEGGAQVGLQLTHF